MASRLGYQWRGLCICVLFLFRGQKTEAFSCLTHGDLRFHTCFTACFLVVLLGIAKQPTFTTSLVRAMRCLAKVLVVRDFHTTTVAEFCLAVRDSANHLIAAFGLHDVDVAARA